MNRALTAAVALLVLMAGCVGAAQPGTDSEADASDHTTISVSATGSVDAAPDEAVVHLAVEARADTAEAARGQVADDMAAVREALADAGVADDEVVSTGYHLHVEYDYRDEDREPDGYRAIHSLRVTVGVDEAGAVVDAAVGAGATRVSGVRFVLSEEASQDLREQALAEAVADARADADAVAAAGSLEIVGVESISTTGASYPYPGPVYREAADGSSPTTFEPGQVTVSATVSVVYAAN